MNDQDRAEKAIIVIEALARTQRKQGRQRLGDAKRGYCCMGVFCKVLNISFDPKAGFSRKLRDTIGLNGDYGNPTEYHAHGNLQTLASLNDHAGWKFKRIAEHLRTNAIHYFRDKVGEIVAKHYADQYPSRFK